MCLKRDKNKSNNLHEYLLTAREGNVFTGVCLSTIGLVATRSLLSLVMARSVRILLECCLVNYTLTLSGLAGSNGDYLKV